MRRIAMLFAAVLVLPLACAAGEMVTVAKVIDGDTIRVWDEGKSVPVRFLGVDTPETSLHRKTTKDARDWGVTVEEIIEAGKEARAFIVSLAPVGSSVWLETDKRERDKYGRILAYIHLSDNRCLNEELVKGGYALVPPQYPFRDKKWYLEMQREAKERGKGFWPTLWRHVDIEGGKKNGSK